ncbi:MAG: putative metal-binding motif-containing protein, partial [Deltaproteobacteria bacterium]|nr:putative metal-binding motif-containing protein [Deltaproteobacteria bacterium]
NGLDDDCDGGIDEGYPTVGTACYSGVGACRRPGSTVCASDGHGTVCNAAPGAPGVEECGNTVDEDCDGHLDNGFDIGAACTNGTGACQRSGVKICAQDGLGTVCDAVPGTAGTELCQNGEDDDCDGYTDEGFSNLGQSCSAGVGACLAAGSYVCSADLLGTVCNATPGSPTGERCDNVDNDCNGVVDNGCDDDNDDYCDAAMTLVGVPAICPNTTGVATLDCNDGDSAIHPGAAEICGDNRDQNCDGNNSEGCPACDTRVDADLDGSNQCDDCDETNGAVHPGATERCNGVDDDCDDQIDEDFDGDNDSFTTCGTVLPGGGLDPAYVDCDDGNAARHPFACELCALDGVTVACGAENDGGNNVDEDCDGWRDEGCSPCDPVDRDGDGVSECAGDCLPGDGAVAPGRAELCDGKDNDCNAFTTENCDVGDPCHWPTEGTDECRERLICVESLGPSGRPTGDYTCTSFCNFSQLGLGLGDGCASNQTCSSSLTPTANLHGCSVATDFGTKASGLACSRDTECRSGNCYSDGRIPQLKQYYCTDLCGSDAYCANGTTCQLWGSYTGHCYKPLAGYQTLGFGVACSSTTATKCVNGNLACVEFSTGNKKCTKPCCDNSECPAGYFCSLKGNDAAGPIGGYDTVPVCWPEATATEHDRVAGQACSTNNQCASEFCDRTLDVCVDICCNDSNCPLGLSCESALVTRANNHQSFARVCVNLTPADALQPK